MWPDAYYLATNTFKVSDRQGGTLTFAGANPCALDRLSMLAGASAAMLCSQQNTSVASLLPSDLDGSTPPPSGEPNTYGELANPFNSATSGNINLYTFRVSFGGGSPHGRFRPASTLQVAPFSVPCGASYQACVPQPIITTSDGRTFETKLDTLADRLMYRLAYRNFGDHESLVVTHSVDAGTGGPAGVRWYEIRSPVTNPYVYQQGTFALADGTYRWMGSAAMDKLGDIAIGYSASSLLLHPSVRYAVRSALDPLGTISGENSIVDGLGSQIYPNRWGDYSSMSVDPVDDCTFWYTNEYFKADQITTQPAWSTRIGAFKLGTC